MFGFSAEHIFLILVVLLIFGPKRLPDLGHAIGRTLKNFKDGMSGGSNSTAEIPSTPPASQIPAPERKTTASAPAPQEPVETKNI